MQGSNGIGINSYRLVGYSDQQLAAMMHELKSPLVLINHLIKSLDDTTLELTDNERKQHLDRIKLTSERMLRLAQHFTVSYRLTDNQMSFNLKIEPVNLRAICEDSAHELSLYAKSKGQTIRLKSKKNHIVLGDREMLSAMMINLLDNSLSHGVSGGTIDILQNSEGDFVRLGVRDYGIGISKNELSHLGRTIGMQPQPLSGRPGTSGLGLYIVGRMAKAMGGNLGVGRERQGSTFFIDLLRSKQLQLL